jgi:hypothetical protein
LRKTVDTFVDTRSRRQADMIQVGGEATILPGRVSFAVADIHPKREKGAGSSSRFHVGDPTGHSAQGSCIVWLDLLKLSTCLEMKT